jgi:putative nucleotidyltransferase with HDIG domain
MEDKSGLEEKKIRILVVDDDVGMLNAIKRTLRDYDCQLVVASSPMDALSVLQQQEMDILITDQAMPDMSGTELLTIVRKKWPQVVGIMMTGCSDIQVAAEIVNHGLAHFFITKPWSRSDFIDILNSAIELYQRQLTKPENLVEIDTRLVRLYAENAAFSLARAVDARDEYTHRHSENVSSFSVLLGKTLGLKAEELEELRIGGLLHDVGKIGVPDGVLLKQGRLTDEEFSTIRQHPVIGVSIIEPINFPWNVSSIIRHHHENYDGSGYPDGLKGEDIPLAANIIRVADAYDAMASNRVYRTARTPEWIAQEFRRFSGSHFCPDVVDAFFTLMAQKKLKLAPN